MLKTLLKYTVYFVFFIFMIVVLLPKNNIYFLLQKEIKQYSVELITKDVVSSYFTLALKDTNIKYENIDVGQVSNVEVTTYLLSTKVDVDTIKLDSMVSKFIPSDIDKVSLEHSIMNPNEVNIQIDFKDGLAFGSVDLLQRVVKLNITISKKLQSQFRQTIRVLKKTKTKGNYTYEYKF
ncbi:MAG: hypothetical protein U9N59_15675 [Campylobacterota bacterium]|nr:hypothetical protein [Campylobacterota bacterium]